MKNRLDVKVSLFQNCKASGMPVSEISLCDFLSGSTFRGKYKTTVDRYRAAGDEDKNRLKTSLPAVTVSGTFSKRNSAGLIAHSGLICIDIDEKDNPDVAEFDRLNELIRIIPYVVYCGHSIGGKGYFVIIPIASPEKHKEHFEALRQDFARCDRQERQRCNSPADLFLRQYSLHQSFRRHLRTNSNRPHHTRGNRL